MKTNPEEYPTIFLTERSPRHQQDALAAAPPELDVLMLYRPSPQELWPHLAQAVFLISERTGVIDAAMIEAAPNLRLILRLGSLAYDIDLAAARGAGVVVTTWPLETVIMVAEHVIMQLLALAKRLREVEAVALAAGDWGPPGRTDENTFAFNWSRRSNIGGFWQKTVGILGFGEAGAEVARRLQGWGCRVLYYRRRQLPPDEEARLNVHFAARDDLLASSDYVVSLLPYSAQTAHALGASEFEVMKPGACLAHAGSGSVIDEEALAAALRNGRLAGAALDTYEWEPLQADNPLRRLAVAEPAANVLLTPHTAGAVPPGAVIAARAREYTPILQFLRDEPMPYRLA